ncbi:hypothetical protein Bp8pS_034 [Bacillus phage vB_BpuM-BpSp]|nr:hypothetical protein Bp8pS_034 [Bacillus phage vB_BpuM-BpSp]
MSKRKTAIKIIKVLAVSLSIQYAASKLTDAAVKEIK